jgi:uncharacterized protein (TIGR00369 family)
MEPLPYSKSCFVCGAHNPHGLGLRFETDGELVRARFRPREEHNGFKGVVHGGILATVLDEVMVWGCSVKARRFFYCAEMTVRYLAPAKPGEELLALGRLAENKRDKLFLADGEIRDPAGQVLVKSTGKYMPIQAADMTVFADDFLGTEDQLRKFIR